jgi:hypothetical protein
VPGPSVAGDGQKVDRQRHRDRAHEIAQKDHRAFQHTDQQQIGALIGRRHQLSELVHPRSNFFRRDEDFGDIIHLSGQGTFSSSLTGNAGWLILFFTLGINELPKSPTWCKDSKG